jgi:hypothetical protein
MDDITDQFADLIFNNKSVKKKVRPIILGGAAFNFILVGILIFIMFRVCAINRKLNTLFNVV